LPDKTHRRALGAAHDTPARIELVSHSSNCGYVVVRCLRWRAGTKFRIEMSHNNFRPRISACILVILSFFIEAMPIKFVILELIFGKDEAHEEASYGLFYGVTTVINVRDSGLILDMLVQK
jgi:hypothetical protein